MNERRPPRRRAAWSWRSRAGRGLVEPRQALAAIAGAVGFLAHNTQENMRVRGIQSGFDFLGQAAGFDIGETVVAYDPSQSYGKALWIGVLNTLRVAVIGIVLTTVIGVLMGVGRFSHNALVRGICYGYVELFRNVPVLLQLLMWYLFFVDVLPPPQAAWNAGDLFFLSKGGLSMPWPVWAPGHAWMALGALLGVVAGVAYRRWAQRQFELTGQDRNRWLLPLAAVLVLGALGWMLGGAPREWSLPEQLAFMVDGGVAATPEFMAGLGGLGIYNGAFRPEGGGGRGQNRGHRPHQAAGAVRGGRRPLRVIIPPQTSQYLNLTKSSSLAVAIGYPDVVSIANTTLNQTGRAVECIAIIMIVYLSASLSASALMNAYNQRVAIKER